MVRPSQTENQLRRRLAHNVRRLRTAQGVAVQEIAERAGMHWRSWQKIEGGDSNATLQTLARLASALGVDAAELIASPPSP